MDQALIDTATELGKQKGRSAGSWVIDGNSTAATATKIMKGLEEGDPEILDMCPAPLSGEFAGDVLPQDVGELVGIGLDGDTAEDYDEVLAAYEDGFTTGYWEEVQRSITAMFN